MKKHLLKYSTWYCFIISIIGAFSAALIWAKYNTFSAAMIGTTICSVIGLLGALLSYLSQKRNKADMEEKMDEKINNIDIKLVVKEI